MYSRSKFLRISVFWHNWLLDSFLQVFIKSGFENEWLWFWSLDQLKLVLKNIEVQLVECETKREKSCQNNDQAKLRLGYKDRKKYKICVWRQKVCGKCNILHQFWLLYSIKHRQLNWNTAFTAYCKRTNIWSKQINCSLFLIIQGEYKTYWQIKIILF